MKISTLKEAYKSGSRGEPEKSSGRFERLAYRLGVKSLQAAERSNDEYVNFCANQLESASASSVGLNKVALSILKTAAGIPNQCRSIPIAPMIYQPEKDKMTIGWSNHFSFGPSKDASRTDQLTPIVQIFVPLVVDSTAWSHNANRYTVDNLVIETTSHYAVFDDGTESIGPAKTTIRINTREYDPENLHLSDTNDFTEGVKIEIDEAGSIVYLGLTKANQTGYKEQPLSGLTTNIDAFMSSVKEAVTETVYNYSTLSGEINFPKVG